MKVQEVYKKYSRDKHTKEIITVIAQAGFMITLAVFAPNAAGHILKLLGWMPDYKNRKKVGRAVESLKKRGLVNFRTINGKTSIYLTEQGKEYYKKSSIESIQLPKSKIWDHVWTLITFDIPETEGINRRHFYRTLLILGMHNLEKSVFVYPYECRREVEEIAEAFLVSKYVRYIRAGYIQNDTYARKFFNLLPRK